MLDSLEGIKQRFTVESTTGVRIPAGPEEARAITYVDKLKEVVNQTNPSFFAMRELRQDWDHFVAQSKHYLVDPDVGTAAYAKRIGADSIRNELAKSEPSLSVLNQKYSFWKRVESALEAAPPQREFGRKIAAGAVVGGRIAMGGGIPESLISGQVTKGLMTMFDSTAWRSVSAVNKQRLADAIYSGNAARSLAAIERIRTAAKREEEVK